MRKKLRKRIILMIVSDRVKFVSLVILLGIVLSVACFTDRISQVLMALIVMANLGLGLNLKTKD